MTIQGTTLLYFLIPTVLVALFSSYVTWTGLPAYNLMKRASWTPPGFMFSIVWTLIYTLIIIAGYQYYVHQPDNTKQINFLNAFYIQLLLNFAWVVCFFGIPSKTSAQLGLLVLFFLFLLVVYLAWVSYEISKFAFWVFVGYAVWIAFAYTLNLAFVSLNH